MQKRDMNVEDRKADIFVVKDKCLYHFVFFFFYLYEDFLLPKASEAEQCIFITVF